MNIVRPSTPNMVLYDEEAAEVSATGAGRVSNTFLDDDGGTKQTARPGSTASRSLVPPPILYESPPDSSTIVNNKGGVFTIPLEEAGEGDDDGEHDGEEDHDDHDEGSREFFCAREKVSCEFLVRISEDTEDLLEREFDDPVSLYEPS